MSGQYLSVALRPFPQVQRSLLTLSPKIITGSLLPELSWLALRSLCSVLCPGPDRCPRPLASRRSQPTAQGLCLLLRRS